MKRNKISVLAGAVVLFLAGCTHIKGPNPTGRTPTTYENVLAWNAALADTNYTIATEVIKANDAGQLDVPTANRILTAQSQVADADRQLTLVLQRGQAALAGQGPAVQALVDQIRSSLRVLTADGTAGLKNPDTKKKVDTAVQTIFNLADLIVQGLKELKVITWRRDGSEIYIYAEATP